MSEISNKNEPQLNIELDEKVADGVYSNLTIINHSTSEFVADFVSIMPGTPKAKVTSRVILTPQSAKRLLFALQDNIQRFEKSFGKINDLEEVPPVSVFGTKGEA